MPPADLIFAAVLLLATVGAVIFMKLTDKGFFEKIQQQLRDRGFAVSHSRQRYRGSVSWVWGRYATPAPFYLHFSNRDPVASVAGRFGIADVALGHPKFDAAFYLRSNRPEWAKEFMSHSLCDRLVGLESIEFVTSSIGALLTPDYWPDEKNRDLRDLWLLRTDGKIEEPALNAYIELAKELSMSLQAFCASKSFTPDSCRSGTFEGR